MCCYHPMLKVVRVGPLLALGAVFALRPVPLRAEPVPGLESGARAAHDSITEYLGPQTCVACHLSQAQDLFHAVHYQQTGPTPNVPNIPGNAGKLDMAFNTYCGTPMSSRQFTCAGCHTSYGRMPTAEMTADQLNNIDCLMCHQDAYKRKAAPPYEMVTFTDYQGVDHTWQLPVEDALGNFQFEPDEANMTISIVEAARTVHMPTRRSCLRCHAYAAGSDCGKRGDLSSVNVDPPPEIDIHMSSQRADLTCQACHQFQNHRFLGRGLDLRENDRPEPLTCKLCHPAAPHDSARLNRHAAHVACQSCHIPTYAKAMTTEVERNWNNPVWSAGLLGGQGGYKPEEVRAANLIPAYAWYDQTSWVYIIGQVPTQNADGEYELAYPYGAPTLTAAQLMPMKEHWSNAARHDATGQIVPHATFKYFVTGDFSQAVADGMAWAGLEGSWTLVPLHTYQTINHGVVSHDSALACGDCHAAYSGGDPVRMDLQGQLGYGLKGPQMQICTQCHEYEQGEGFAQIHNKHVSDKHYDCRWCHEFSRRERNLTMPTVDRPGDLNCDGSVDFWDINPFVLVMTSENAYYAKYACNHYNADTNADGQVGFPDINPFVALLTGGG